MGGRGAFVAMCVVHGAIAVGSGGVMMMLSMNEDDIKAAARVAAPEEQMVIRSSESFSGVLLVAIGVLLLMVSTVADTQFHAFFAKGGALLHLSLAGWRLSSSFHHHHHDPDSLRHALGHLLLALSWLFFLVYSWADKYD